MLPVPPDLSATVDEWTDAQLFRIVKHGIRFTGMPAWPTQTRDDEVWMMVAFLRALPEFDSNDLPPAGHRRRRDDRNRLPAAPPATESMVAAAAHTCRFWQGKARPICAKA